MGRTKTVRVMDSVMKMQDEDFGNIEDFKVAAPVVNEQNAIVVNSNFDELATKVRALVLKYGKLQLTEENVNFVKMVKSNFVSLRTSIDRERKDWTKIYLDPAKNAVKGMCDDLLKLVAEGEDALGKQLDSYDQKRKDELTLVLKEYSEDAASRHGLRPEYAEQIQLLDKYYNKTQHEEDSIDDIERQASELEKKQKEYDSGVALIKMECEDTGMPSEPYIRELAYKSAAEIVYEIKTDKKSQDELKAKEATGETVVLGEEITEELKKSKFLDEKAEVRERVLRVRYKPEQASIMADFFKKNNIQFEFIKTDF